MSPATTELFMRHHKHQIQRFEAALRKTTDWNESARLMHLIDYHEAALNRISRECELRKVSA